MSNYTIELITFNITKSDNNQSTQQKQLDGTRRAAVTLTFDLFNPKSNQCIYEPKYISDQNHATTRLTHRKLLQHVHISAVAYIVLHCVPKNDHIFIFQITLSTINRFL